ncbi:MAG: hypothetical protein KGJ43_05490 [Acidobacteriota bacterium]|nr:hypothetical protein [Acidobacteriota bacterium]
MPRTVQHTPRSRDAALAKLSNMKRWLFAGTTALTGALTVVAANAFPGRTVKSGATTADNTGPSSVNVHPGSAQSSGEPAPLQRPSQAPGSSSESGGAREGGSGEGTESPGSSSGTGSGSGETASPESGAGSSTGSGESGAATPNGTGSSTSEPATTAPRSETSEAPATREAEAPVVSGGS